MHNTQNIQQKCLVFRRWSRKAWAVRASIGKQVKIGHLSVDVCDATYAKTVRSGLAISMLQTGCSLFLNFDDPICDDHHCNKTQQEHIQITANNNNDAFVSLFSCIHNFINAQLDFCKRNLVAHFYFI